VKKVELGDFSPIGIARDPASGDLWLWGWGHPRRIQRVTPAGDLRDSLPIEATCIAFASDGTLWVTTENELLKLGTDGKTLASHKFEKPSKQCWLTAF
jgi:sugar lactone lactonase YvrE